jgi:CubicO group peptidase (beta-lactamase class C family)
MRRRSLLTLFALALPASLALPAAALGQQIIGARDARAQRVDSVFRDFDHTDSPGCAVGVYQDGKILYGRGYGMASLEHGVAMSPRSVLDVGSISKQFTAMSILMLQKEGKLSLEDPIRKYIPEMPAYADKITLRRALSQTSGLRDIYEMIDASGHVIAGDSIDALHIITHFTEPNFEAGERYLYSNSGWLLAAQIVYRLTGKTLDRFADERIFQPLGMHDTRFQADANAIIPNGAEGYAPRPGGGFRVERSTYDGSSMGAGAIHTSIEDFGRWLNNYDEATVGGRDIIEIMTTPTKLSNGEPAKSGPTTAYAVGLNTGTLRGLRINTHGGVWAGYRGQFYRFPDQHFGVATFCNLTTAGPDSLARKVAAIYLGDRMQPDSAAAWTVALAGVPSVAVPAATLRRLEGVWRNVERGEARRTRLVGDSLIMTTGGERRARMVPLDGDRFRAGPGTEIRFEGDAASPSRMIVRTFGETVTYARAASNELTLAQLAEYAGDYRSPELEATYVWKVDKGQLVLYVDDRRVGVLEPTYRDGFARGGDVFDVHRDPRGRITGFTLEVSGGWVRHLKFTKVN